MPDCVTAKRQRDTLLLLCVCVCVCVVCCGGDEFSKRLQAGVKWVSSIDIHPGGEGVCVCVCVCVYVCVCVCVLCVV